MASASSSPQPSAVDSTRGAVATDEHLPPAWRPPKKGVRPGILLGMVLVIATAGLVYELCMAAVASYLLGDSVRQFSLIIGVYLSALGLGAYLSSFVDTHLELRFVDVELGAALVGGFSAPLLFVCHGLTESFHLVLYATVLLVGVLVGLELPLLMRILRDKLEFKQLVARALTFDYAGALLGSVGFSMVLLPYLGLTRASLACGLLNALVALASTWVLQPGADARAMIGGRVRAIVVCVLLSIGLLQSSRITELSERYLYAGKVVHTEQSRYQRIVVTERGNSFQLYLNGNLQFSSDDEHRYHEALVHPAMQVSPRKARVLVGGGGDGLAVREVLKWPGVERLHLVDLDPAMTRLGATHPRLERANAGALSDPRVHIDNSDAFIRFGELDGPFDVVILDFPDPSNYSLGKLYSVEMYRRVARLLAPGGTLAVQSTSPFFARKAFWCIEKTIALTGLHTAAYHVFVPSFGDWGFVLAKHDAFATPTAGPEVAVGYLDALTTRSLFAFPSDMGPVSVRENRLETQALVAYYLDEWERWN